MKLMYCIHCGDVLRLRYVRRVCSCGKSAGRSTPRRVEVSGPCAVLSVNDGEFMDAVEAPPRADGTGVEITVSVLPNGAAGVTRIDGESD